MTIGDVLDTSKSVGFKKVFKIILSYGQSLNRYIAKTRYVTILDKTINLFGEHKGTSFILEYMANSVSLCFYPIFNNLQNPSSLTAGFVG